MNKVILLGRLTKDPELSQTPSGVSLSRFTIAVNRRYKEQDGKYPADFINCTAWRQTAEFVNRYFHKGSMIAVVGSIQTRSWDGQDGKRQYATEVVIDEAYFTGKENASPDSSAASPSETAAKPTQLQQKQTGFTPDDYGFIENGIGDDDCPF